MLREMKKIWFQAETTYKPVFISTRRLLQR